MTPTTEEHDDEALNAAVDEATGDEVAEVAEVAGPEEEASAEATSEASAEDKKDYDWFTGAGAGKPESAAAPAKDEPSAEADVLEALDGARAERAAKAEPFTPSGFDVFADRSGPAEAESEPVTGHWDEPETELDAVAEDGAEASGDSGEWADAGAEWGRRLKPSRLTRKPLLDRLDDVVGRCGGRSRKRR